MSEVNNISILPYNNNIKSILSEIILHCKSIVPNSIAVILFGSYARYEQNLYSDLDILVLTDGEFTRLQRGELRNTLEDYKAGLVMFSIKDFFEQKSNLVRQIRKDGVILWQA